MVEQARHSGGVALLPAAGTSERLGGAVPKVFMSVCGESILKRTAAILHSVESLRAIVVMVRDGDQARARESLSGLARVHIAVGGATRQESVLRGLRWAKQFLQLSPAELVLVHDAARCLVSRSLIERALHAAASLGAVTAALPMTDTVTSVGSSSEPPHDSSGAFVGAHEARRIERTLARSSLFSVQTPQVFRADILLQAYEHACGSQELDRDSAERIPLKVATDDVSLVERIAPVFIIPGERTNVKITYPEDMRVAEFLLRDSLAV